MALDEQTSGTTDTTTTTTNAAAGQNSPASTDIEALGLQITDIIQNVVKAFVTGKTTEGEDVFVENANFAKLTDSAKTIIKINTDAEGKTSEVQVNYEYIVSEVVKLIQSAKVDGKKLDNGTIDNTLVITSLRPALDALAQQIKADILGSTKEDLDTFEELKKALSSDAESLPKLIQAMTKATSDALSDAKAFATGAIDDYDRDKVKPTRETVANHEDYIRDTAKPTFINHETRISANEVAIGKIDGSLSAEIKERETLSANFQTFETNRTLENQKHIDEIVSLKAAQVAEIASLKAAQVEEIASLKLAQAKEFQNAAKKIKDTVKISFKK